VEAVRRLVEKPVPVLPHPYLKAGRRVRVVSGPLTGMEGFVSRDKNGCRFVISVDLLGRSVAAEIDASALEPL
jgi:transcription antitermination factor NusG